MTIENATAATETTAAQTPTPNAKPATKKPAPVKRLNGKPVFNDEPPADDKDTATSAKPEAAKKPTATKKPAAAKKPAAPKKPVTAKKPAAPKKPVTAKKAEEPASTKEAPKKEPVSLVGATATIKVTAADGAESSMTNEVAEGCAQYYVFSSTNWKAGTCMLATISEVKKHDKDLASNGEPSGNEATVYWVPLPLGQDFDVINRAPSVKGSIQVAVIDYRDELTTYLKRQERRQKRLAKKRAAEAGE